MEFLLPGAPSRPFAELRMAIVVRLALTMLVAFVLLMWIAVAAHAQGTVPAVAVPAWAPDATALLTAFGLGKYAAGIVTLIALLYPLDVHLMAVLPPPSPSSVAAYRVIYALLNACAGNWGKAKNAPSAVPGQPPHV